MVGKFERKNTEKGENERIGGNQRKEKKGKKETNELGECLRGKTGKCETFKNLKPKFVKTNSVF